MYTNVQIVNMQNKNIMCGHIRWWMHCMICKNAGNHSMDHVIFTQLCNIKRPLSNAQCIMQTTSARPAPIKFRMFLALECGPRTNKCTASCHYSLLIVYCLFCGQCWRVLIFVFARIFALSRGFLWIVQRKYSWKLYLVLEILYIVPGILYIVLDYFIYSSGDFIYSSGLIYVFVFGGGAGKILIYSSRGCAAVAPRWRRGGAAVAPRCLRGRRGGATVAPWRRSGDVQIFLALVEFPTGSLTVPSLLGWDIVPFTFFYPQHKLQLQIQGMNRLYALLLIKNPCCSISSSITLSFNDCKVL